MSSPQEKSGTIATKVEVDFLMIFVPDGKLDDERTHRRRRMERPSNFQTAVITARHAFRSESKQFLFESKDDNVSKRGDWREIEPEEWEFPNIREYLWTVRVQEVIESEDHYAVSKPNEQVKIRISNLHDPLGRRRDVYKSEVNFTRSTTIREIKEHIAHDFLVKMDAFSLQRLTPGNKVSLGCDYLYGVDNIPIAMIFPDQSKIVLGMLWKQMSCT